MNANTTTFNTTSINNLDKITVIMLNARTYTATKKLRREDLKANGVDISLLPPDKLAHLGCKKIVDPKKLATFSSKKKEAERLLLSKGVRFLGGFAVPREEVKNLVIELGLIKDKFLAEKEEFIKIYHDEVEKWIAVNPPEWETAIRKGVDSIKYVDRAMQFSFVPIKIASEEGMEEEMEEETSGLYGQLCRETRTAAKLANDTSFAGKLSVTRKALRPIVSMRDKMAGLIFLNPAEIQSMIGVIDQTIAALPKSGPIEGVHFNSLVGLIARLSKMGSTFTMAVDVEEEEEEVVSSDPIIETPAVPATETAPAIEETFEEQSFEEASTPESAVVYEEENMTRTWDDEFPVINMEESSETEIKTVVWDI